MDSVFSLLTPIEFSAAFAIALLGGLIKGMVGFALPMIMISGLSMFLAPDLALASLISATVVTNGIQALRHGGAAAWASVRRFRLFLVVGGLFLVTSAQLVPYLRQEVFLLVLGVPVTFFALLQLFGWTLHLNGQSARADTLFGMMAGAIGGMSGVWGPPTVLYLTAMNTPKAEQVRIQGVVYGLGALALVVAHTGSGVLRSETWPLSLALVVPALAGALVGTRIQDRIDQVTFRKVTLIVLTLAGLNLIRRGLFG
ncbi:MAG: TSUP family transporter [Rhodobacteraceae bacterium]|nr:TSUP family transporter [Paracoccaceae bacterium]